MSTGEESFVPVEEAEVKSAMPNEELDTPTKASSMKEGAEDSTPSGKRFPLPDQAKSSQATYVFKPDKPKMGGLVRTGREDWTPWVGGKPKIDWSELADSKDLYIDPRQFRPTSAGSAQKSKGYRMVAVEPKLSKGSNLLDFQKIFKKRLESHGLDTITYLPDPEQMSSNVTGTNSGNMLSILTHHSRYTRDKATSLANEYFGKFDMYDRANNEDAKELLYNSIDTEIQKELDLVKDRFDTFVEHWMEVVSIIRVPTTDKIEAIKKTFRERKMDSYKGHDIVKVSLDYQEDWRQLDAAGLYTHDLTAVMLNEIMESDGGNEEFLFKLRPLKEKLDEGLLETRYYEYSKAKKYMEDNKLDVPSVLKLCRERYTTLKDKGKWSVSTNAKDSKAISGNYGKSANAATINDSHTNLHALVNALMQSVGAGNSKGSDTVCFNCGKKGHFARDCPEPKKDNSGGKNRNPKRRGKHDRKNDHGEKGKGRNGRNSRGAGASRTPPGPNESEIKMIDGKKKYWCKKCNRWTLSHGTDQHGKKDAAPQANSAISRVDFDLHPVCMKAQLNSSSEVNISQNSTQNFGSIMSGFAILWWLYFLCCSKAGLEGAIPLFGNGVHYVLTLLGKGIEAFFGHVLVNSYLYFAAVLAGIAGFGTLYSLYTTLQDKDFLTYRLRGGEGIRKQYLRKAKRARMHERRIPRWKERCTTEMKYAIAHSCLDERSLWTPHHHVRRLPRPQRRLMPVAQRLCRIENVVRGVHQEMKRIHWLIKQEQRQKQIGKSVKKSKKKKYSVFREIDLSKAVVQTNYLDKDLYKEACKLPKGSCWRKSRANADSMSRRSKDRSFKAYARRKCTHWRKVLEAETVRNPQFGWALSSRHNPIKVNWNSGRRYPNRFCGMAKAIKLSEISSLRDSTTPKVRILFDTGANCCVMASWHSRKNPPRCLAV